MKHLITAILIILTSGCIAVKPKYVFGEIESPRSPDYGQEKNWAALPDREDMADLDPDTALFKNVQDEAEVDVFFIHPTTYTGKRGEKFWNANLDNAALNLRTDEGSIKYQSSIFNGVGRVFAPRYRQAHYHSYFTDDKASAQKAFIIAYEDIKKAFEYYLEHYNQGRPIILAGHSQGAQHGHQLLKDFFDEQALAEQLIVAYLVGMPIKKNELKTIEVCQDELDTRCFCSWRTFKKGHIPKATPSGPEIGVTNPLNWTTTENYADAQQNLGAILRKFEGGLLPAVSDAQIHNGYLWASKPDFPGSIFITFKNYHVADFNLFYANVRKNAQQRAQIFLSSRSSSR